MKFFVEIDTDNAAFEDGDELAAILQILPGRMQGYRSNHQANQKAVTYKLQDSNGNTCGSYGFRA